MLASSQFNIISSSKSQGVLTVSFAQSRTEVAIQHFRKQLDRHIGVILCWADGTDDVLLFGGE